MSSTVLQKNDFVYAWTIGQGGHDRRPVMLSEYIAVLEDRLGDAALNQIRDSLDLEHLPVFEEDGTPVPLPGPSLTSASIQPTATTPYQTHTWVGREANQFATCIVCGVHSNSVQADRKCTR